MEKGQKVKRLGKIWGYVPQTYSREQYEVACLGEGVTPMSDTEIKKSSYGIIYGDADMQPAEIAIGFALARPRLRAIEAEAKEARAALIKETQAEELMIKAGCGHMVRRSQLMAASLGTCCPDCYDKMSD